MKPTAQALTAVTTVALLMGAIAPSTTQAQPEQEWCETDGDYEPAADTLRTVELPDFNIAVSIPENYRLMRRQNGEVEIAHPDDYEWLQCLARGGSGGHGYYSERINRVERDPSMSLREQAIWSVGYRTHADGSRTPSATQVFPYQANGIDGYIATSQTGYSVTFLGTVPGLDGLLKVSAGCDCGVDIEDVADLLLNIRPLE